MGRALRSILVVLFVITLILNVPAPTEVEGSDCSRTSVGFIPLNDLGTGAYRNQQGGLYPNGSNAVPRGQLDLAASRAAQITPLDPSGQPSPNGEIVFLSIGMSNANMEFTRFVEMAVGDPQLNPRLELVNGAQNGADAKIVSNPQANYWLNVDQRIAAAGVTNAMVQVIWLKEAIINPSGSFPDSAISLGNDLREIVGIAFDRYPNLQIIYLASRIYGGYAQVSINPEPYAYESGFAVKWLIERQIGGDPALNPDPRLGPVQAPVLLWGPYLWADGLRPRSDGLVWECGDVVTDGVHPSTSGQTKVAQMLLQFFKTSETTAVWFTAQGSGTPGPGKGTPTPAASTPTPTPTMMKVTMTGTDGQPPPTATLKGPPPTPTPKGRVAVPLSASHRSEK